MNSNRSGRKITDILLTVGLPIMLIWLVLLFIMYKRIFIIFLPMLIIPAGTLICFQAYQKHIGKQLATASLFEKPKIAKKQIHLLSKLRLLIYPGFFLAAIFLVWMRSEGFLRWRIYLCAVSLSIMIIGFFFDKKTKELKKDVGWIDHDTDVRAQSDSSSAQAINDYYYDVTDQKMIRISRYIGSDDHPVIPGIIQDLPVRVIGQNAFAGSGIKTVSIPEGVESIETNAFADCENLTEITLPATLRTLGIGVFQESVSLRQVILRGFNEVFSMQDGILYDTHEKKLMLCPPGLELEQVKVEYGCVSIGAYAFYQNTKLKYVVLPPTLKTIEDGAFLFTKELKMIELPPYLEKISEDAFLMARGFRAEKTFEIYAFRNTYAYRYAEETGIKVNPLYAYVK